MDIARQILVDIACAELTDTAKRIQQEKSLTVFDMENILYKLLDIVKSEKEVQYSTDIVNLAYRVQQLEKEVKNDKPNDQS